MSWLVGASVVAATLLFAVAILWLRDLSFEDLYVRYGDGTSRFIDLPGGVHLHYRDLPGPDGPVLVLVHGFTASSLDWAAVTPLLQQDGRVLLVDLPGHGLTGAPADYRASPTRYVELIAAFVERLKLRRYVVVGSSMGGLAAWRFAVRGDPNLVGLVLVGAVGWTEPPARPRGFLRLLGSKLGRFILCHADVTPLMRRALQRSFADPALATPVLVRRYMEFARAPGHRAILTSFRPGSDDLAREEQLASIHVPTLVIAGEADRLVPLVSARRFAAAIPRATLVTYPNIGHVPMLETPEAFASDLRRWLAANQLRSTIDGTGR